MTEYQHKRIADAKDFVERFKLATPCRDCGERATDPEGMFLAVGPNSTYTKPIGTLVRSGASFSKLSIILAEREPVCKDCFRHRQSRSWESNAIADNLRTIAAARAGNVVAKPKPSKFSCPPLSPERIERYAKMGVRAGDCDRSHPFGDCTWPYFDIATGNEITYEELMARVHAEYIRERAARFLPADEPAPQQPSNLASNPATPVSALEALNDF